MGLERIGALLQGKHDNYDTDLMRSLIEASAQASGADPDGPGRIHHRVIADHLRSTAFLIADGVMPANDGRGYVLRRIMRRAMRHAHQLGAAEPLMHRLVPALVRQMGTAYPELVRAQPLVEETLRQEETRFRATLERGLRLLSDEVARLGEGQPLPGDAAFRLYDTYGFPLDLTQDALREVGRTVDTSGFEAAMAAQKARARAAWAGSGETAEAAVWFDLTETHGATEFLGYETEAAEGQILALVRDGRTAPAAEAGARVQIVLNQTPFYAEAGGQAGDTGSLRTETGRARITDTRKAQGLFVHLAEVTEGLITAGQGAELAVDSDRRAAIRANHSATHLLHEALRGALGSHVAQKGSLNAPDRLRFDFAHGKAMTPAELRAVEAEVNAFVRQDSPVLTRIMSPDAARALGAQALFGEKYGEEVRVVSMGRREGSGRGTDGRTYSIELCGGTHVGRTGEIGAFALVSEAASAAGVRRIEALTGQAALDWLRGQADALDVLVGQLRAQSAEDAGRKLAATLAENRDLAAEVARLRRVQAIGGGTAAGAPQATMVGGVRFLARTLAGVAGKELPPLVDELKAQLGSGVVLVIADTGGKAAVAAGVTGDLTGRLSAVELVRAAAEALGGKGGGGRADFAQAGGADPSRADAAVRAVTARLQAEETRA
jgi:alanyl-tRNA synthetase